MGLFNKNKKEKTIQKAHSLINESKIIDAAGDKLINNWQKELRQAKTAKERAKINDKYEKANAELDRAEDKNYKEYYHLMHKEFGEINVEDYQDLEDKFMDHKLVDRLAKRGK